MSLESVKVQGLYEGAEKSSRVQAGFEVLVTLKVLKGVEV